MSPYLIELRRRLIQLLLVYSGLFIIIYYASSSFLTILLKPLQRILPATSTIVAIDLTSTIITPVNLSLHLAVFALIPYVFYQFWQFISPALNAVERSSIRSLLIINSALFYLGLAFGFYIILPFMFTFFIAALPVSIQLMPNLSSTIDFTLTMLYLFGFCFQIPVICVIAVNWKFLTVDTLIACRPYYIVSVFIIGMLLTPPDVFSQILVAIPLWLLFEAGILFIRFQSYLKTRGKHV